MKLEEAKHILKESGCLLERADEKRNFTNAEWKEFKAKIEELGIKIHHQNRYYIFFHADTGANFGTAEKEANNSWRVDIYDMELGKHNFRLMPKDYYGPVVLTGLEPDEAIKVLERYNDAEYYLSAVKNKTIREVETKFKISKAKEW